MVCVPAKLGHVFEVGSLGCAQKSFGEVAKFLFWARTKLHKQVLQKMATLVYCATHCRSESIPNKVISGGSTYVLTADRVGYKMYRYVLALL